METSFDEQDAEVTFYADYHEVSLERAVEVSNWMADVAPLLSDLHRLTDIFTKVRIVHGGSREAQDLARGDVRVEVSVTDAEAPEFIVRRQAIEDLRAGDRPVDVVVFEVPRSLAELDALASAEFTRWPAGSVEAHYDVRTGTVTFSPSEGPAPGFSWLNNCSDLSGGTLDGGRATRIVNHLASGCTELKQCTTGFPMRFGSTYGVTTAGHCLRSYPQNSSGYVLNHTDRDTDLFQIHQPTSLYASTNAYWYHDPLDDNPAQDDVGYLRRVDASVGYPGRLWKYSTGEWRNITAYEEFWADEGQTVCVSASSAAYHGAGQYCGAVTKERTNSQGEQTGGGQAWTEVNFNCPQPDVYPAPSCIGPGGGSSGGPVYFGGRVYGIYTNADNCLVPTLVLCSPGRYYRTEPLYWKMKEITSDVHFICYPSQLCGLSP